MSVSIRACPTCSHMLIGDSPSCPHCGHVLDARRAATEYLDLIPATELKIRDSDDERACRQCGEMVRIGLVRCWHCGAFTNTDIEASYHRMQANPTPIMYSDITHTAGNRQSSHMSSSLSTADDDGGFELADGYGVPVSHVEHAVPAAAQQSTAATYDYHSTAAPQHPAGGGDDDDFTLRADPQPVPVYTPAEAQAEPDNGQQAAQEAAPIEEEQPQYWGYKLSADGTQWEVDYEVWQQAGLNPNAQPGEAGYYNPYAQPGEVGYFDPYAAQRQDQYDQQVYSAVAAEAAPLGEVAATGAEAAPAHQMPEPPEVAHSVSTGGESLFAAAVQEEKESVQTRKAIAKRKLTGADAPVGSFLVYCPNGHRVQVQERHRGRAGRCPSCKAVFFVPMVDPNAAAAAATAEGAAAAVPDDGRYRVGDFNDWMFELRIHTVNPTKLKLKPGAMAGEYDVADVAFSDKEMLVATVFKRAGAFAAMSEKKKKPVTRQAIGDYLQTKKPLSALPAPFQTVVTAADAGQLKIVQPAIPGDESIFAGIPVFGDGRIVVRLPVVLEGNSRTYLSFSLSEFREFSRLLLQVFNIIAFGRELGIPLTDTITPLKCHYSEVELPTLENADWYTDDPALKPIVIGRKCAGCGLIVSEDSRKKEKIGGKNDASIAKANCPKCKKKFGDIKLFGLDPKAKPVEFGKLPVEK